MLKHPEVRAVSYTPHNDHETLYWLKAAVVLKMKGDWFYEKKWPFPRYYARHSLRELLKENEIPVRGMHMKEDLFRYWQQLSQEYGPVFFEKSPHHLNHFASTKLLTDYFLTAGKEDKIIGLIRHPGAVIYSTLNRWYVNPVKRLKKWTYTYDNLVYLQAQLPDEQLLLIRYEDMIDNPEASFRKVCEFLGLEYNVDMGTGIHGESRDAWKEDKNFAIPLTPAAEKLLRHFGYPALKKGKGSMPKFKRSGLKGLGFRVKSRLRQTWVQRVKPLIPF